MGGGRRRARGHIKQLCNYKTTNEFNRRGVRRLKGTEGGARRMCSLLPDSLKAKEAGGAPLGFQLLKLKRKVNQEVVEQVWQYTVGVLGKVKPMH